MKLYFVRHGETEWNVLKKIQGKTDIPLNERGKEQARALAASLAARKLHAVKIYTSPQLRAVETAEIIGEALHIECEKIPGLVEMDLGEWEGLNWDRIEEEYAEVYHNWNEHRRYVHTPGGECYNEVLGRTLEALKHILAKEQESVIIVTHSAILMSLRVYLSKLPFEEMVERFKTKNTELVEIGEDEIREAIERFERGE